MATFEICIFTFLLDLKFVNDYNYIYLHLYLGAKHFA